MAEFWVLPQCISLSLNICWDSASALCLCAFFFFFCSFLHQSAWNNERAVSWPSKVVILQHNAYGLPKFSFSHVSFHFVPSFPVCTTELQSFYPLSLTAFSCETILWSLWFFLFLKCLYEFIVTPIYNLYYSLVFYPPFLCTLALIIR